MAVQARHLAHAFRGTDDATTAGGRVFLDEFARCAAPAVGMGGDTTMLRDFPRSDLTCGGYCGFEPRKRARVADGFFEDQRVALTPAEAVMQGRAVQVPVVDDALASTSGRAAANVAGVSGDGPLLSRMYNQGAEIDALIRLETERMRAGLEDARRRHARALLAAAERAASGRLRAAEAELECALRCNAELEDRARQAAAECQAWMGVARSHEAVAAGLRATLDQLVLQSSSPCVAAVGEGDAEDAQSCCFEFEAPAADAKDDAASRARAAASSCKACGGGEASVLLLPCSHLCLCRVCEAAVDACPVCAAAKNGSLVVLFS